MALSAALRRAVLERARNRCEYCQLAQAVQAATFHVDHVIPIFDGGAAVLENLALACISCSLRKGARRFELDQVTGTYANLFHPRHDRWNDHFAWDGIHLTGRTPEGRATIDRLQLNREELLGIRAEQAERGCHPPPP